MNNMAYFFRDVNNYQELEQKTNHFAMLGARKQRFQIIDIIDLEKEEFKDFQNAFIKTWDFIKKNSHKLNMSLNAEYKCLLIKNNDYNYGFLVNADGYYYPRIIAFMRLGENV